jgi:hypothetical protein
MVIRSSEMPSISSDHEATASRLLATPTKTVISIAKITKVLTIVRQTIMIDTDTDAGLNASLCDFARVEK